jgi:hypothetical protein
VSAGSFSVSLQRKNRTATSCWNLLLLLNGSYLKKRSVFAAPRKTKQLRLLLCFRGSHTQRKRRPCVEDMSAGNPGETLALIASALCLPRAPVEAVEDSSRPSPVFTRHADLHRMRTTPRRGSGRACADRTVDYRTTRCLPLKRQCSVHAFRQGIGDCDGRERTRNRCPQAARKRP